MSASASSSASTTTPSGHGLLLGFAGFRPEALRDAVKRLTPLIRNFAASPRAAAGA
jgi:hypothetical protein